MSVLDTLHPDDGFADGGSRYTDEELDYDLPPTAQCDRCGRDFRPDDDPASPDHDLCAGCADHAVLCGCNYECCGEF